MNLGLGLNIASTKSGGIIVPVLEYQKRVLDDSGLLADASHPIDVYLNAISVGEPSLLCACDAYKVTVLYNVIPE